MTKERTRMTFLLATTVFGIFLLGTVLSMNSEKLLTYRWATGKWVRDQNGRYPLGSVLGGYGYDKESTFICRVKYLGHIIPGKLVWDYGKCYISYDGKEYGYMDYEVLVQDGQSYEWKDDHDGDIWDGAVVGGMESNYNIFFVCRVEFYSSDRGATVLVTGKMQPSHGRCYVPYHGYERSFSSYQILRDRSPVSNGKCYPGVGARASDIILYEDSNREGASISFKNPPTKCANIDRMELTGQISSVWFPARSCFRLYFKFNCDGSSIILDGSPDDYSDLTRQNFNDRTRSLSPCFGAEESEYRKSSCISKRGLVARSVGTNWCLPALIILGIREGEGLQTFRVNDANNPIREYTLDENNMNRVVSLRARILPVHLRRGPRVNDIRTPVRNHMALLRGPDVSAKRFQAGHIIAWRLGGPSDALYNFYPQLGSYNMGTWRDYEGVLFGLLNEEERWLDIEFNFDYNHANHPGIPSEIRFRVTYSNGEEYRGFDQQIV